METRWPTRQSPNRSPSSSPEALKTNRSKSRAKAKKCTPIPLLMILNSNLSQACKTSGWGGAWRTISSRLATKATCTRLTRPFKRSHRTITEATSTRHRFKTVSSINSSSQCISLAGSHSTGKTQWFKNAKAFWSRIRKRDAWTTSSRQTALLISRKTQCTSHMSKQGDPSTSFLGVSIPWTTSAPKKWSSQLTLRMKSARFRARTAAS